MTSGILHNHAERRAVFIVILGIDFERRIAQSVAERQADAVFQYLTRVCFDRTAVGCQTIRRIVVI